MTASSLNNPVMANVKEKILLGRFGTADEVASAVKFLASDDSQYITAQTVGLNGGLYF